MFIVSERWKKTYPKARVAVLIFSPFTETGPAKIFSILGEEVVIL